MVRCVVNGTQRGETIASLADEARNALADTVVQRGDTPLPVRTPAGRWNCPRPCAAQLQAAAGAAGRGRGATGRTSHLNQWPGGRRRGLGDAAASHHDGRRLGAVRPLAVACSAATHAAPRRPGPRPHFVQRHGAHRGVRCGGSPADACPVHHRGPSPPPPRRFPSGNLQAPTAARRSAPRSPLRRPWRRAAQATDGPRTGQFVGEPARASSAHRRDCRANPSLRS